MALLFHFLSSLAVSPPPFFNISATNLYGAGKQQGQLAGERIRGWLATDEMRGLRNFTQGLGRTGFLAMIADNTRFAPTLVTELQGIADGAGVEVEEIWGATMINELEIWFSNGAKRAGHCSDIYAIARGGAATGFGHGHNEDWPGPINQHFFYVAYQPIGADADFTSCAGLAYPGGLIGWAPSWNAQGTYLTQNSLFPIVNRPGGLSSAFVQRQAICPAGPGVRAKEAAAGRRGIDRVIGGLVNGGWSSAASINIVDVVEKRMANVEAHLDAASVSHSLNANTGVSHNMTHFNQFKHLEIGVADEPEDSSMHRQATVDSMAASHDVDDIKARLSDTSDTDFPLFRDMTIATITLNGTTADLNVWCCGHASASTPPLYKWNLLSFFADLAN